MLKNEIIGKNIGEVFNYIYINNCKMGIHAISKYYNSVQKIIAYGANKKETAIRNAFMNLISEYAEQKDLLLIPELDYRTIEGKTVFPDGTLKDALRLDYGYYESKDSNDNLAVEIEKKFRKGYPNSNILFEDSVTAVLYQQGREVLRCKILDAEKLDNLLTEFISYTRPEIRDFHRALEQFKIDLPNVLYALRSMIDKQGKDNKAFVSAREEFLEVCKETINAEITIDDVNEMLIQHILTEEIFTTVFDDPQFHQENNISKELHKLEDTFFTGSVKRQTLDSIKIYYQIIKARATQISNHIEKQKFLKVIYENFYKAYNPKGADRLGIVYTPDEIVKFMIEGTDFLLEKFFKKVLASKNVEILDPATGTGTYISDLIEYLPKDKLEAKYRNEIHANEVSILPYYIANLNIEATFKQKMGYYSEFQNICFVDTLDNVGFEFKGKQTNLFGALSAENAERVKRQNERKISVIIGNPPYNANQANENDNNKNREYKFIDKRIKETYIYHSNAQKTKVYDMYARFYRWASDRLDKNGIIAIISNRSFIDSRTFDGFRKCVQDEFNEIYIVDTRSDVRANPKISGTKHNVFGIQTGVAIMFLIKREAKVKQSANIYYFTLTDEQTKQEKLAFFRENKMNTIPFEKVIPDKNNNWINLSDNDFDQFIPLASKNLKGLKTDKTIFHTYSNGIVTARDEWVYDLDRENLLNKIEFFYSEYNDFLAKWRMEIKKPKLQKLNSEQLLEYSNDFVYKLNPKTKWSSRLRRDKLLKMREAKLDKRRIVKACYRPFTKLNLYLDYIPIDIVGQQHEIFPDDGESNKVFFTSGIPHNKPFQVLASDIPYDFGVLETTQGFPLYIYDSEGNKRNNVTDWGLQQFVTHYGDKSIKKENIFYYCYAVLHNSSYRVKYAINLKREFPKIPFYNNFWKWVAVGKRLMEIHIGFEKIKPYKLLRQEKKEVNKQQTLIEVETSKKQLKSETTLFNGKDRPKLKADKLTGEIIIDEKTKISGIPPEAWEYKLGNRSAIEWVLDQFKEKKVSDPTVANLFDKYEFSDYKEQVIDLISKVCAVSVETVSLIRELENL